VDLVLAYCRAAGLDPMQKPVHIVPMWDSKTRETRDVVMPGIGLYRTNAARTGEFAGMSEPEFGPMVTEKLGTKNVTFPEWCKVTVSRQLPTGHVAQFTSVEYWIENYAIKGGKEQDQAPNAMWSKRVRGQLAKCAQAQALRMAFPEAVGNVPTADEMEGKHIIEGDYSSTPRSGAAQAALAHIVPEDSPERDALIESVREVAYLGGEALRVEWERIGKDARKLIADHLDGFKAVAAQADEDGAEPAND